MHSRSSPLRTIRRRSTTTGGKQRMPPPKGYTNRKELYDIKVMCTLSSQPPQGDGVLDRLVWPSSTTLSNMPWYLINEDHSGSPTSSTVLSKISRRVSCRISGSASGLLRQISQHCHVFYQLAIVSSIICDPLRRPSPRKLALELLRLTRWQPRLGSRTYSLYASTASLAYEPTREPVTNIKLQNCVTKR